MTEYVTAAVMLRV